MPGFIENRGLKCHQQRIKMLEQPLNRGRWRQSQRTWRCCRSSHRRHPWCRTCRRWSQCRRGRSGRQTSRWRRCRRSPSRSSRWRQRGCRRCQSRRWWQQARRRRRGSGSGQRRRTEVTHTETKRGSINIHLHDMLLQFEKGSRHSRLRHRNKHPHFIWTSKSALRMTEVSLPLPMNVSDVPFSYLWCGRILSPVIC